MSSEAAPKSSPPHQPKHRPKPQLTQRVKVRPVDVLPLFFLITIIVVAQLSPYPIHWDSTTVGAWAIFTAIAGLLVAAPTVIRFERSFLAPDFKNLPGHVLIIVLVVTVLFFAPAYLLHPATAVVLVLMGVMIHTVGREKRHIFTLRKMLSAWAPALISFFVYENLRFLIGSLNPNDMDEALAALDLAIFGMHHTVALEPYIRPWLTEWMSLNYGFYLLYPVLAGMLFYYHEQWEHFEDFTLAFCLSMYLGFLCYLAVPAAGPIKGLLHLYETSTVAGMTYSEYQAAVMEKFRYIRDAFPSLHVANSLLCLFSLWKPYPRVAKVLLFFELNLIASTIYLRMHYTIDVFAGVGLALLVVWLAPKLNRWAGVPA